LRGRGQGLGQNKRNKQGQDREIPRVDRGHVHGCATSTISWCQGLMTLTTLMRSHLHAPQGIGRRPERFFWSTCLISSVKDSRRPSGERCFALLKICVTVRHSSSILSAIPWNVHPHKWRRTTVVTRKSWGISILGGGIATKVSCIKF
jgi:hypothetical protein